MAPPDPEVILSGEFVAGGRAKGQFFFPAAHLEIHLFSSMVIRN